MHPTIGLITSVGPQHLETFHDIEIVANTKFELIEGVTEAKVSHKDGAAIVTLSAPVADEVLKKAVEDQDYKVISIG